MSCKSRFAVTTCALSVAVPLATVAAAPKNEATHLPAGQVACLSLKDAQNFADYSKNSPNFAADLLDRAACFKAKENMEAVLLSQEKGFTRIKLLSGHTVWFPSTK